MYRRLGMEKALGVGGGKMVSIKSQKSLEKAEELCRRRRPKKALPYLLEAIEDSNNLDALIQVAHMFGSRASAIVALELAEIQGQKILKERFGEKCFEKDGGQVGQFWAILETRPYMRVLQALVKLYFEEKQYVKSTDTMLEMLRLCPGDNTSQRTWLGSNLIRIGRVNDALYFAQSRLREKGLPPLGGGIDFKPPSRDYLPTDVEESLSLYGNGALLYTAALASFILWGDCPKSRQYLRISAKANPNVLLKILGRISRPEHLNNDARPFNGPEEAHDYLWLTQDLWMLDKVWNWADNCKDAKAAILKTCSREGCTVTETKVAEFKRCSACHLVSYCGPDCQKGDWKRHKQECRLHLEQKEVVRAFQNGKSMPKDSSTPIFAADFSTGGLSCLTDATRNPLLIPTN